MKKLVALTLAGVMVFSTPVLAATSPTAQAVVASAAAGTVEEAAAAENKTVGEYLNNAVTEVPGLDSVTPLGQGGHVIINGAPSNQTFSVLKPESKDVTSAKNYAASLGGKILNVAKINASITKFNTATVNFYMKGILSGQNIKVYQLVNGVWVELTVSEIRADHIVVNMTSLGTLAFVELPVEVTVKQADKKASSTTTVDSQESSTTTVDSQESSTTATDNKASSATVVEKTPVE